MLLGIGIGAIFLVPFVGYFPYSPRAVGESASSWEYATSYALPLEELLGVVLPQFPGLGPELLGRQFRQAAHRVPRRRRAGARGVRSGGPPSASGCCSCSAGIAALFLLVSLGADTPFYRAWYAIMPYMKKVRAPGMAFFLVALAVSAFAAFGADRLLRREVPARAC